jgi:hypothetical protein
LAWPRHCESLSPIKLSQSQGSWAKPGWNNTNDYEEEEDILSIQTLEEALEAIAQQHIADALQTVEDKEKHEQTDDKSQDKQDPINIHIQNSPVHTSPTHMFGRE